jgi:flagellar hook-associated protein 2
LRGLQSSLWADASYAVCVSNGPTTLAALGISKNDDGTLSVDTAQLSSSLSANPSSVLTFFQNSSATGFADNFKTDLNNLTDSTQGVLNVDIAQNAVEQTDLTNRISDFQDQLTAQKQQLQLEFSQVNASLEEYPFLLQEVTAQLSSGTASTPNSNTTPTTGSSTS